jgi:superfamily II DNA or RNA helicase
MDQHKDPVLSEEMNDKLETLYNVLLTAYKENYDEYKLEANRIREKIKVLKPPAPIAFRPYPQLSNKNFNEILYLKKEFNRNKSEPEYLNKTFELLAKEKCSFTEFKLTNNQKFVKNFISPLTPYNGLLLFHSVGVGKTCTAISIAEQYLNEFLDPKRVLVILSSNIKDNFKKQIFDITKYDILTGQSTLCTGTKYPDMILDKDVISRDLLEKRINKLIKERYQFIGYRELVFKVDKIMEDVKKNEKNEAKHQSRFEDKLKDIFSNRLIIVDEAHNLRIPSEVGKKQVANTLSQILQLSENTKLVLMTATPMFNTANEIVWLMNLLLTNDKRPNIKTRDLFEDGALTEKGKQELIKATRGYVSYMRGEDPFSFPFRLFPSINKDPKVMQTYPKKDVHGRTLAKDDVIKYLELTGSDMSQLQKRVYDVLKRQTDMDGDIEEEEEEVKTNELQNMIQLCNIAYPSHDDNVQKSYGEEGFMSCFSVEKNSKNERSAITYSTTCKEKFGEILSYENIHLYSPKIKSIIDYVIHSKGIVFIYSQYYYSGIYPLAAALEHIGFVKYNSKNITKNVTVDNKFAHLPKRPSYIVLSRDKFLSPNNDREIAAVKSKDNQNGDIIKVIIVSKVGTEGIDFKRIREVHVLEPWFNLNRTEQIIGRAVRTCSHVDLPPSDRNVTIYLHALKYTDDEESIDLKTYRVAEKKQVAITQVQRVLKENSVDCELNQAVHIYDKKKLNMKLDIETSQGNIIKGYQVGDVDYSYVCDYGKCDMKCSQQTSTSKQLDTSTFNPFFLIDDIDVYKKYISKLFLNVQELTYDQLIYMLQEYVTKIDADVVAFALQEMVDTKYKFSNIYGHIGYLVYRGNVYIFQNVKHHETKLSIEERQDVGNRSKLDMDILIQRTKATKPRKNSAKKTTPNRDENAEKNKSDNKKPEKGNNDSENVNKDKTKKTSTSPSASGDISELKQKYETLKAQLRPEFEKYLVEYILDRLSPSQIIYISSSKKLDEFESMIKDALYISEHVHIEDGKLKYFVNRQDGKFYTIKEGQPQEVGPLERRREATTFDRLEKALIYEHKEYLGYVQDSKEGMRLMVRDNLKGKGYVCAQTSSLTLPELTNRINELAPNLLKEKAKIVKKTLCDIYEVLLRSRGKSVFMRPIYKKN